MPRRPSPPPVARTRKRAAVAAPPAGRSHARVATAAPATVRDATDPTVFRFFNEVGIIEQLARTRFERVMPHRLSVAQFSLLNHFVRRPGELSLVALARAFQVSKPAMGKLVHRLVALGLLAVRDNPDDSRGKLVGLTDAGRRVRHEAIAALAPELARLDAALGAASFDALLPGLVRVREWLDTHR